jgi:ERCC4-type nuclease
MSKENRDGESTVWADAAAVPRRRHQLRVDLSERNAAVLRLARECEDFDVQIVHLPIGDDVIDSGVVVERKTYADFATSLVDGRLFPQAAHSRKVLIGLSFYSRAQNHCECQMSIHTR